MPEDTEAYIHRIGRTGRAGRTGEAILFVENRQRRLLQNIERATGKTIEKMDMPTAEDIHQLQLERFAEKLKERLAFKGDAPKPAALRGYIEQVCIETGRDALDVAAYLVGPAMKSTVGSTPTTKVASAPKPPTANATARGGRSSNLSTTPGRFEKYRVAVGGDDGVEVGNLVGAIANEAGIDGKAIGSVRIFKAYSTVELPEGMPANILALLQNTKVKGKPLRMQLFKPGTWSTPPGDSATPAQIKPKPKPKPKKADKPEKVSKHRKGASKKKTKTKPKITKKKFVKKAAKGKAKLKTKPKGKGKPKGKKPG